MRADRLLVVLLVAFALLMLVWVAKLIVTY